MKKFLFGLLALFSAAFAQTECQIDQGGTFLNAYSNTYYKAILACHEKGYKYFLIKRFSYRDVDGQTMEIHGVCKKNEGGEPLKDSYVDSDFQPSKGINISYELLCFREKPQNEQAVDVEAFLEKIKMYTQAPEKVEGSKVKEVTTIEELNKELKNSKTPVYVDCYSDSCPPCKMLSPKYDTFSKELATKGKFLKVDLAKVSEITSTYEVMRIPTLLIFERGKLKETKEGLPEITSFFEAMKN